MENNNVPKQKMLVFALFILVLMVVFLIIANQLKKNQTPTQVNEIEVSPTTTNNKTQTDGFSLVQKESVNPKVGQDFSVEVLANSDSKNITGFDVLVGYDKTAFQFVKAAGVKEDFKVMSFDNKDWLAISGSRKIQYNQPVTFSNSELVEISFRPLKAGQFNFDIIEVKGNEKTQMVDTDSKIIYPKATNLNVTVQ